MVSSALVEAAWVRSFGPTMNGESLHEFLELWPQITQVQLIPGVEDTIRWSLERDGVFSVRSTYAAKFAGWEVGPAADFTWSSRAPMHVGSSLGWP